MNPRPTTKYDLFMLKTSSRIDRKFSPSHSAAPISFPSSTSSLPPSTGAKSHRMHQPFSSFVCTSLSWWLTTGFSLHQTTFPSASFTARWCAGSELKEMVRFENPVGNFKKIGRFRAFEVKNVRCASPWPKRGIKPGKHTRNCLKKCVWRKEED